MENRSGGQRSRIAANKGKAGSYTILVVDDEEAVLKTISQSLTVLGYTVITAENGMKAVGIYHKRWAEIDGVLLDYLMPEMDGVDVFREMKEINPDVKVLLITGYGYSVDQQQIRALGVKDIVPKPVDMMTLSQILSELLE